MKPNEKRLVFEIDRGLHTSIKVLAAEKHMSIKSWITTAIVNALLEEQDKKGNDNEITIEDNISL